MIAAQAVEAHTDRRFVKKSDSGLKSKKWVCKKCNSSYTNPIPCVSVTCAKCTKAAGGAQKWMSPAD